MASMNISLPAQMKDWVEKQTGSGRYDNTSEYVRDLIRHDQDRATEIVAMQRLIDDAVASGVSSKNLEEIWALARERAIKIENGD